MAETRFQPTPERIRADVSKGRFRGFYVTSKIRLKRLKVAEVEILFDPERRMVGLFAATPRTSEPDRVSLIGSPGCRVSCAGWAREKGLLGLRGHFPLVVGRQPWVRGANGTRQRRRYALLAFEIPEEMRGEGS